MFLTRILEKTAKTVSKHNITRFYCQRSVKQELTVPQFCNININLPCNVNISLLDVHKYHNSDKLVINSKNPLIEYKQSGNDIEIYSEDKSIDKNNTCDLKIPVKANVKVLASGDINADSCSGSYLILCSQNGNVNVNKYQGEKIELFTTNGDICVKGAIITADLKATVEGNGSIRTNRLQALKAAVKVKNGDILVDSSYCDDGSFLVENGALKLQNVHKKANITIHKGNLILTGVDGEIDTTVLDGDAEIQISRILNNSQINISGKLNLKLSEDCQDNTMFEINSSNHIIDPSLKQIISRNNKTLYLTPKSDKFKEVNINCNSVQVESASWADMFQLSLKK